MLTLVTLSAGYDDNPNRVSTVDRIDYSNDTATASPKGPLSNTTMNHGASSAGANGLHNNMV